LNNLDGKRKEWEIAYNHVKNPSIGNFDNLNDFLQKTSYLDLDIILWATLCATCMNKEIISIDCGTPGCGTTYDWIYSPSDLLRMEAISPQTLEEMRITGEADTTDKIEASYNESMLRVNNAVELPHSKFVICFGHISAFDYLNTVYGRLIEIRENDNRTISEGVAVSALEIIKYILIPNESGHYRITNRDDMIKIIMTLDEVDFQSIDKLADLMKSPYELTFSLDNIVCPKCRQRSSIPIPNISRLLFMVAGNSMNANITLKKQ
jgi:hypothetical protein